MSAGTFGRSPLWAATRKKDSYFLRAVLASREPSSPKKAILAVAASMLTDVYYMLRNGTEFQDLGSQYFVERDKEHLTKRLLRRLRDLGLKWRSKSPLPERPRPVSGQFLWSSGGVSPA